MKKLLTNIGLTLGLSLILAAGAANSAFAYSTEGAMYYNEGLDLYSRASTLKHSNLLKQRLQKTLILLMHITTWVHCTNI